MGLLGYSQVLEQEDCFLGGLSDLSCICAHTAPPPRPACQFFYNLFYGIDTTASRLEPLLDQRFATISPATIPDYRAFPTGESPSNHT